MNGLGSCEASRSRVAVVYCGSRWVGRAVKTFFEISSGAPSFGTRLGSTQDSGSTGCGRVPDRDRALSRSQAALVL